ncbi:Sorting nexin-29 [Galemys pyrenaicus]|uniref:Sorting nexin-29 n=1 Tax=Galemys pyrenaicus TaxID=202257 RepID=A0A8J6A841_GALPY|nr:Sorting nexin-29 [Galemys pyrenaicus]
MPVLPRRPMPHPEAPTEGSRQGELTELCCVSGSQNSDVKRQCLLERLLDAVKQCQIRFGGRKEIASDSDSSTRLARCEAEGPPLQLFASPRFARSRACHAVGSRCCLRHWIGGLSACFRSSWGPTVGLALVSTASRGKGRELRKKTLVRSEEVDRQLCPRPDAIRSGLPIPVAEPGTQEGLCRAAGRRVEGVAARAESGGLRRRGLILVTCLCAQFEAVLQHGLKRSRGLALTAAAIKQAAGFASKTETEPVFWFYVKEALNKHELQRFHSLRHIASDAGRGRAWLRCALNEHSLERYLHMLLADRGRLRRVDSPRGASELGCHASLTRGCAPTDSAGVRASSASAADPVTPVAAASSLSRDCRSPVSGAAFVKGTLEMAGAREDVVGYTLPPSFVSFSPAETGVSPGQPGRGRRVELAAGRCGEHCPEPLPFLLTCSTFYEDWSFVMDEERASMLPTMAAGKPGRAGGRVKLGAGAARGEFVTAAGAQTFPVLLVILDVCVSTADTTPGISFPGAGLNSILFAINIDNKDLNGQSKFAPTVSDLLKESTQNVTSLLKESTQGVSSLIREITASSPVAILIKPEQEADPLPIVSRSVSADFKCKKERKKKKKVTNVISFGDEEDERNSGDAFRKTAGAGESSEEPSDRSSVHVTSAFESPFGPNSNGSQSSSSWKIDSLSLNGEFGYPKLDVKSIDDEDVDDNEDHVYGSMAGRKHAGLSESPEKPLDGNPCPSQTHSWAPLQVLHGDSGVLFPVSGVGSCSPAGGCCLRPSPGQSVALGAGSVEASPPGQGSPLRPAASVPESMTINELRQAIVAMMSRKDELEEENRSLRSLLDGEMEHSAALRQEVDSLKRKGAEQEERHVTKVQALETGASGKVHTGEDPGLGWAMNGLSEPLEEALVPMPSNRL